MSLESDLAKVFRDNNYTWKRKSDEPFIPDEDDIAEVLDEAAATLYAEPVGAQLEIGRLIIIKTHRGHDVYVHAGNYN